MCTVTIVHTGEALRIACNRDESRRRVPAHPPFIRMARGRQVLTPQDPQGGGTWIAANNAGMVFTLLNSHGRPAAPRRQTASRGLIIPALADCGSVEEFAWRLDDIAPDAFAPCRLLAADDDRVLDVHLDAGPRTIATYPLCEPLMFTSSSLGDALVHGPRRLLFEQMVRTGSCRDLAARQDAFHAHRWRDRPALSVHMSRPDACTVSTTVVESTAREVRMIYQPAYCIEGTPVGLIIKREQVACDRSALAGREHAAV